MKVSTCFETPNARRYQATLIKHFGHKVPAVLDHDIGRISLPFALCDLRADDSHLILTLSAETQAHLDKAISVMSSHLERFAFRENPQLTWSEGAQA